MSRIKIVMLETLKGHLKSGAFWVMILLPVIFGVLGSLGGYFASSSGESQMGLSLIHI